MRTLVIGGNPGHWRWNDSNRPFKDTNGVEAFVDLFHGEYRSEVPAASELVNFDLVIGNLNPRHYKAMTKAARDRPRHVRWVCLVEGSGESFFDYPPLDLFESADLVATINSRTTAYFQSLTTTRVRWIGIPYPLDRIASYAAPVPDRGDQIFICPRSNREPSIAVARALGRPVLAYASKVSPKISNIRVMLQNRSVSRRQRALVLETYLAPLDATVGLEKEMYRFFKEAAVCRLWINLDPRHTWARFVLDAAALRMPIVTTESTDHGPFLFPETTVRDAFAVEEAIDKARRVLNDPEFAAGVSDRAFQRLERYRPEACSERLMSALQS